jgi:glycosyltransferase involved in cell wall biosynthesis
VLKHYLSKCKAFVFAAEENFGMLPVEAQACGTPVIAYGKGGVLETVLENRTGVYFNEQTTPSIIQAVETFELNIAKFNFKEIANHALIFSPERFRQSLNSFIIQVASKTTN